MQKITPKNIPLGHHPKETSPVRWSKRCRRGAADVTLININLMYATISDSVDLQLYLPLGALYLASCLEKEGFSLDFRDYQLLVREYPTDPFNLDRFSEFARNSAPIVGLSCMSNLLPWTLLAAQRLKKDNPETIVVLGGVGPTGVARQIIENFDWIDYVCYGEGEASMVELITRLKSKRPPWTGKGESVPGFFFRRQNRVVYSPRPRITDLNSLPLPAYHLVKTEDYDAAFSIITSRGCPFHCKFCTETNHWHNQIVFRGIDQVIEEIKFIKKHSLKRVFLFQDDQITLNRGRAKRLFKRLVNENLGLSWKSFVRVDQIDEELLDLMAAAGCIQVRFGVESGSNRILREIKKGFTIEKADAVIRLALKYIPSVHASFIWGFPFETIGECRESIKWIRRFQEAGCTVLNFLLSPLPNSEIYRNYNGPLDFNNNIMSNFNNSGGENVMQEGIKIIENSQYLYDFIRRYPRIFPGFFLYDYEHNVAPKMRIVHSDEALVFRGKKKIRVGSYEDVDL